MSALGKSPMPGKIMVYPDCQGMKLTPLTDLAGKLPLADGQWNKRAEETLTGKHSCRQAP